MKKKPDAFKPKIIAGDGPGLQQQQHGCTSRDATAAILNARSSTASASRYVHTHVSSAFICFALHDFMCCRCSISCSICGCLESKHGVGCSDKCRCTGCGNTFGVKGGECIDRHTSILSTFIYFIYGISIFFVLELLPEFRNRPSTLNRRIFVPQLSKPDSFRPSCRFGRF
jgi:hypothetical protein